MTSSESGASNDPPRRGSGSAWRLAVGTLTVIPTGPVAVTPVVAGRAMALAPLAVLPLAATTAVLAWALGLTALPSVVVGLLAVAVLALGTRALHLDGLADTADGLGSGWDRRRALEVMRRGDVGPMGVVTLVVVVGLQAALIGALAQTTVGAILVGLAVCASRCAVPLVCAVGVRPARPDGLGAAVAGTVARGVVVTAWVLAAVAVGAFALWALTPPTALLAVPLAAVVLLAFVRHCVRRFGGVTGDVIGASVEIALTVMLIVLAI